LLEFTADPLRTRSEPLPPQFCNLDPERLDQSLEGQADALARAISSRWARMIAFRAAGSSGRTSGSGGMEQV